MIIKIKKNKIIEHYGNQKWDISDQDFICNDNEFQKLKDKDLQDTIEVRFANPSKLPKGWINQGYAQGYDPYIYIVRKDDIQDEYFLD